mmetsp:Transcript_33102/g.53687  ORF Transcript_33102/g.53687 Transcript_33102/m.53687 type:complete len:370 (-) Transcript_33102:147-1256(-)
MNSHVPSWISQSISRVQEWKTATFDHSPQNSDKKPAKEARRRIKDADFLEISDERIPTEGESREQPLPTSHSQIPIHLQPKISIIIDDVGIDRKRSLRAIELPSSIALSFLPYAADVSSQVHLARSKGHEVLVHVPMEPNSKQDPGPNSLKVNLDEAEIRRRTQWHLDRFDRGTFVGVNNHMGSKFTTCRKCMQPVLQECSSRGIFWLDSLTSEDSVGADIAQSLGMSYARRDVFLDHEPSIDGVRARLGELERVASQKGVAIAIGHPKDCTLQALQEWFKTAEKRGFRCVPLSDIVHGNHYRSSQDSNPCSDLNKNCSSSSSSLSKTRTRRKEERKEGGRVGVNKDLDDVWSKLSGLANSQLKLLRAH